MSTKKKRTSKVRGREEEDRIMTAALGLSALANGRMSGKNALPILTKSKLVKPKTGDKTRADDSSLQSAKLEGDRSVVDTHCSTVGSGLGVVKMEGGVNSTDNATLSGQCPPESHLSREPVLIQAAAKQEPVDEGKQTVVIKPHRTQVVACEMELKTLQVETTCAQSSQEDNTSNSSNSSSSSTVSEKTIDGGSLISSSGYSSKSESSDLDSPVTDRVRSSLPPKKRKCARQRLAEDGEPATKVSILQGGPSPSPSPSSASDTGTFTFPHRPSGPKPEIKKEQPQSSETCSQGVSSKSGKMATSMMINPQRNLRLLHECQLAVRADDEGDLPLHIAVVQNRQEIVQKVIPLMQIAGVSIDFCNKLRQTALHLAVVTNQPHMVFYLLQHGACPNVPDRHGNNSVHLAIMHEANLCLEVLLRLKPNLNIGAKNFEGLTALHLAVQKGKIDMVPPILQAGGEIDAPDGKSGRTPLHHAVETNQRPLVEMLLSRGANVNQQSYAGSTALHVASGRSLLDIVGLLVKYGADTTLKNIFMEPTGEAQGSSKTNRVLPSPSTSGETSQSTKQSGKQSSAPSRDKLTVPPGGKKTKTPKRKGKEKQKR